MCILQQTYRYNVFFIEYVCVCVCVCIYICIYYIDYIYIYYIDYIDKMYTDFIRFSVNDVLCLSIYSSYPFVYTQFSFSAAKHYSNKHFLYLYVTTLFLPIVI